MINVTKNQKNIKQNSKNKSIYILLTRFDDNGSKAVSLLTRSYYTHASIGLEEDMNTFYSFVHKGFIVEKVTRYIKPGKDPFPCALYEIKVSDKTYRRVKAMINSFVEAREKFKYTSFGVAMCLFGIPHKENLRYFCSQFVAEVLKKCGVLTVKKNSALYLPRDLRKLPGMKLNFKGNLLSLSKHFGLLPTAA